MCPEFQQLQHIDFNLVILVTATLFGASSLFLYCFFGKLATESHEHLANCLYEANWLALPVKLQKYFIIMIENSQQPLYYHGFGVVVLDLDTFTNVSKYLQYDQEK